MTHFIEEEWKEEPPAETTIVKLITQARNHPISELDSQWSIGCLARHEVPPEALRQVLDIYEKRLRTEEYSFTIREALWVARLHKLIDDPIILECFASAYAVRDKIDWILDNPIYTRSFDFALLNYCNPTRRDEVVSALVDNPSYLHPFPSSTSEEEEEVIRQLKKKGYDIEPPGMKALHDEVERLWLEELPKLIEELQRQQGLPGYVMTPEEQAYGKWVEEKLPSITEKIKDQRKQRRQRPGSPGKGDEQKKGKGEP